MDLAYPAPWDDTIIHTEIIQADKKEAAEIHNKLAARLERSSRNLIYYTDGSKLGTNVGAAFVCSSGDFNSFVLGEEVEVYDGEFYAIYKAAQHALVSTREGRYKKVTIFSDNQACVKRLSSPSAGPGQQWHIKISNVAQQLENRGILLSVQWVPGHTGVEENEKVDLLAKEAAERPALAPLFTSLSFLKRKAKEAQIKNWLELWKSSHHGKSYSGSPRATVRKVVATFPRKVAATITQLRIGHGHFNSYLVRIAPPGEMFTSCACGAGRQDPRHLILECRFYRKARKVMKEELKGLPIVLCVLLYTKRGLAVLSKYLTKTQIATRLWRLGTENDQEESWSTAIGWGRIPTNIQEEEEASTEDGEGEEAE